MVMKSVMTYSGVLKRNKWNFHAVVVWLKVCQYDAFLHSEYK